MQSNKMSFKGERVYVGIDVHLKQWAVSVRTAHITKRPFSQSPDAKALKTYLTNEFPDAEYYSAYEAGFCGFAPHHELESLGIHNIVFNAADISDTQKERLRKTDAVDCVKISRNLLNGELDPIYVPGRIVEGYRNMYKLRINAVKSRTRMKNRIKSLLYRCGISYPEQFANPHNHWSKAFRNWLREEAEKMSIGSKFTMLELVDTLEDLNSKLLRYDREICKILKTDDYAHMDETLRTIPGIGRQFSAALCFFIVDINRFETDDALASFIGLVPDTRSSGDYDVKRGITYRCNKTLRTLLIETAWRAVAKDPALAAAFTAYCNRGLSHNASIIRIARKIVNRIRYVLRSGNKYELRVVK